MRRKRKPPDGQATTDLVFSAHLGGNSEVFPQVLGLHVPPGAKVADVTYGKGVFWRQVPAGRYRLFATDIQGGVDCRALPYRAGEMDCVVLDPPYMEGFFRADDSLSANGTHVTFRGYYSSGARPPRLSAKWHNAVLELYLQAAAEAARVLRKGGALIVKCQDEVSAGVQRLTHIEIIVNLARLGFYAKDIFVVVRRNKPGVTRMKRQAHARKNHSYFLVFEAGAAPAKRDAIAVMIPPPDDRAVRTDPLQRAAEAARRRAAASPANAPAARACSP